MTQEKRPAEDLDGAASEGTNTASIADDADMTGTPRKSWPRTMSRAGGIERVDNERNIHCRCFNCGREFYNTGAAASHARSKRHLVEVSYYVCFSFAPRERK